MLRTYRCGEFTSVEFGQYCADHDIGATPLRAILAIAERHGGTAEPDGRRHVKEHDEGQEEANRVLGRKTQKWLTLGDVRVATQKKSCSRKLKEKCGLTHSKLC